MTIEKTKNEEFVSGVIEIDVGQFFTSTVPTLFGL